MFAEFELALYEAVERGEALTGERISEMYGEIVRRYHGHAQDVVLIDDLYTNEWLFIPHFYYNMYVFQYATSQTAGTALYRKIIEDGEDGVENYKNLLRAGGSDYPYKLLANAGVDLATAEPVSGGRSRDERHHGRDGAPARETAELKSHCALSRRLSRSRHRTSGVEIDV